MSELRTVVESAADRRAGAEPIRCRARCQSRVVYLWIAGSG